MNEDRRLEGANILHLVGSIEQEASGPSYSVPRLCEELQDNGLSVELHTLGALPSTRNWNFPIITHPHKSFCGKLWRSKHLKQFLEQATGREDCLVHNHGLWHVINMYPGLMRKRKKFRLVCSPRGTLSSWAMNRRGFAKKLMWYGGQKCVMAYADCIHVTSELEAEEVRRFGIHSPLAIIPNGIDVPEKTELRSILSREPRQLLFLSRIHPKKGIDTLLRSWEALEKKFPNWTLTIAGPDDADHLKEVKSLAEELGLNRVSFPGPVYAEDKTALYYASDLFVLPTHSENFGLVVAEALAHGIPAVVTHGAPWKVIEDERAGKWIEDNEEALRGSLSELMSCSPEVLQEMGLRGQRLIQERYDWSVITEQFQTLYNWLLVGGPQPACVTY